MFWLSYECFSILCNAFLLKSVNSSHNSCVALIVLGQHCIVKNPMQYCLRGSRQHPIKKVLCKFALTLLEQHFTCQNPMQCCPKGS